MLKRCLRAPAVAGCGDEMTVSGIKRPSWQALYGLLLVAVCAVIAAAAAAERFATDAVDARCQLIFIFLLSFFLFHHLKMMRLLQTSPLVIARCD